MIDPSIGVVVAGDAHGTYPFLAGVLHRAAELGYPTVLQLGDFGYEPGDYTYDCYLAEISKTAARLGVRLVLIDGNHDNIVALQALPADDTGFVPVADQVWWAQRGHRWTWAGVRFAALGGAYSVDRQSRVENTNWWPEETITDDDLARLGHDPVDVLVCHDMPGELRVRNGWPLSANTLNAAEQHRDVVSAAVGQVAPRLVVHGHYHHRHTTLIRPAGSDRDVTVEGFAADYSSDGSSWGVIRLADLSVTDGYDIDGVERPAPESRFRITL